MYIYTYKKTTIYINTILPYCVCLKIEDPSKFNLWNDQLEIKKPMDFRALPGFETSLYTPAGQPVQVPSGKEQLPFMRTGMPQVSP